MRIKSLVKMNATNAEIKLKGGKLLYEKETSCGIDLYNTAPNNRPHPLPPSVC